ETALLLERWERVRGEGLAQAVLLGGEAGIGKSRLGRVVNERLAAEPHAALPCGCSAHPQNSAVSARTGSLERVLGRDDADDERLGRLEAMVRQYGLLPEETVPLLAALVALPTAGRHAPLGHSPERQRQLTQDCVLAWLLAAARTQPLLLI